MHRSSLAVAIVGFSMVFCVRLLDGKENEEAGHARKPTVQAEDLVQDALQAELAGDNVLRAAKLKEACELNPEYGPAHWHMAHVKVGRTWWTIAQAERQARTDKNLAQYRMRRDQHAHNLDGETRLARWCE